MVVEVVAVVVVVVRKVERKSRAKQTGKGKSDTRIKPWMATNEKRNKRKTTSPHTDRANDNTKQSPLAFFNQCMANWLSTRWHVVVRRQQ